MSLTKKKKKSIHSRLYFAIEKQVKQEVAKTMPSLPRCCRKSHRGAHTNDSSSTFGSLLQSFTMAS